MSSIALLIMRRLSIVRLFFLFMASNEDLNMKATKARTFLCFLFLIFYLRYIPIGIYPVEGLGTTQLRDCKQITFVILDGFFPFCKNTPLPSCSEQKFLKWIEYLPKSNEKYTSYLHCTSSFEGNSCIKICKMSHQIFYFLLFYTSIYIIQQTSFFTNF